jgi:uncharacterized Zn-binding protein involved in type VI secretion
MVTPAVPPIPHVGGPITLGSTGVMIGKKPAARMGDMAVCVGPPSSVILGEMTVMIGEAGSGSQAGSAGSAAAAAKASTKGPATVNALTIETVESEETEIHDVTLEFVDSAGNPLAGVPFSWKDPTGAEAMGYSNSEGKWYRGGYAEAGSVEVTINEVHSAKWGASKIKCKEKISIECTVENPDIVNKATFSISAQLADKSLVLLESKTTKITAKSIKSDFVITQADIQGLIKENSTPKFVFTVIVDNMHCASPAISLSLEESDSDTQIKEFEMSF